MDGGTDGTFGGATGDGGRVRSLREVFASMSHGAQDPVAAATAAGHPLPGHLMTEAIISYADSAPLEVAEHLAPFVVGHSAVPGNELHAHAPMELHDGFALLSSAPTPGGLGHLGDHLTGDNPTGDHLTGDHLDPHQVWFDGAHQAALDHGAYHRADAGAGHHGTEAGHPGTDQPAPERGDLWFGHGQESAPGGQDGADAGHPDPGHPDAGHLDPSHLDPGHLDPGGVEPWLAVHDEAPDHLGHGFGWEPELPELPEHEPSAHPDHQPVDEPAGHDLPIDLGHS